MASYLSPGVYVEEKPSGVQVIAGVGTSTAAFIGLIEQDEIKYPDVNKDYDADLAVKAMKPPEQHEEEVNKLNQEISDLQNEINVAEDALNKIKQDLGKPDISDAQKKKLTTRQNDQQSNVSNKKSELENKKNQLEKIKNPSPVSEDDKKKLKPYIEKDFHIDVEKCVPKLCTNFGEYSKRFGSFSIDDSKYSGHRALSHAVYGFFANGGTRCYVARVKSESELSNALKNFEAIDAIAIVAAPGLTGKATWEALIAHCELCKDRFAILDGTETVGSDDEVDVSLLSYETKNNLVPPRNKNAAYYFPFIQCIDPAKQLQDQDPARGVPLKHRGEIYVPPSGHIAGVYAKTDEERGVHKSPANAAIRGAVGLKYYIGRPRHDLLNPQGVNAIRNMNGNISIWGARTIGGDKNGEWKYLSVRRLFLFLRESIDEGTQWVVFEPNDRALWGKIRRNVGAFLTTVWRSGALFGSSPEEAFYVKCDDETNPPEVREMGQVVTEIGVAIVRPAEFVIFRIQQDSGKAS